MIIEQLESGTAPWRRPWRGSQWPRSITGHRYRGINFFLTLSQGYASPFWLTRRQIEQRGGRRRNNEFGTEIIFWKKLQVRDEETDEVKTVPLLRYYKVWNLEQCEGIEAPATGQVDRDAPLTPGERHHRAEDIVAGYPLPPRIEERGTKALYRPADDLVRVPPRERFDGLDEFTRLSFTNSDIPQHTSHD